MTPGGNSPHEPWFRIGSLDVSTTVAVVLLNVVTILVFAVEGGGGPVNMALGLDPDEVLAGQVWRLVTWPISNPGISLWSVLAIAFFWYFGKDLESEMLGRTRMLRMVLLMSLVLGLLLVGIHTLGLPVGGLATIQRLEFMVLLVWVAEWPQRRFLFGIPAWVIGAVLVGLEVLQLVGYRLPGLLLHLLVGILGCALVARREGLLAEYAWIPRLGGAREPGGRRQRKPKRQFDPHRPTVVHGGWSPTPPRQESKEEARMNELLDRIHASGIESLTDAERAELVRLRDHLRGR